MTRNGRRWKYAPRLAIGLTLLVFAASTWMGGCATNPATGKRQISLVSSGKELEIGRESDPAIIAEYGLYGDQAMQRYVDGVGQRLARESHLPNLAWHFRVLDSPTVNAFALPGGYIYITRGILAYMSSEAQLAGVLGHEIGHVTARHSAEQITRSQLAGIGLLAGAIFVDAFRPYSGIAQQGMGLLFLKYSRDNENQADALGIEYATKAGYDPRESPATYATLKRIGERASSSLPSFLSSHPDPGDREIRTGQLAKAAAASARRPLEVGGVSYRGKIEGLVFGDDPRNGYFDANRFYHPEMAFQMIFPLGWKTANQPSQVIAKNEGTGAAMQLTLVTNSNTNLTPAQYVDSLRIKGEVLESSGRSDSFRDYPAWVGTVVAKTESGRSEFIAGWVRIKGGQFLQVLGEAKGGGAPAEQIFASIRSIAALTDPAKLNVTADRLAVRSSPRSAPFSTVWESFGALALSVEDGAILNSTRATATMPAGAPVKIVKKGTKPR